MNGNLIIYKVTESFSRMYDSSSVVLGYFKSKSKARSFAKQTFYDGSLTGKVSNYLIGDSETFDAIDEENCTRYCVDIVPITVQ